MEGLEVKRVPQSPPSEGGTNRMARPCDSIYLRNYFLLCFDLFISLLASGLSGFVLSGLGLIQPLSLEYSQESGYLLIFTYKQGNHSTLTSPQVELP